MVSRLMYAYAKIMGLGCIAVAAVTDAKSKNLIIVSLLVCIAAVAVGWFRGKRDDNWLMYVSRFLPLAAFALFAYKANANLLALIGIIQHELQYDAYSKCINVIVLIFLAVASLCSWLIITTLDGKKTDTGNI